MHSASNESLATALWIAVCVAALVGAGLTWWATRLGRRSYVRFWDIERISGRYASGVLNAIALGLSLIVYPAAFIAVILAVVVDNGNSDVIAAIGILVASTRDFFMLLCDMFAKRAPMVA